MRIFICLTCFRHILNGKYRQYAAGYNTRRQTWAYDGDAIGELLASYQDKLYEVDWGDSVYVVATLTDEERGDLIKGTFIRQYIRSETGYIEEIQ